MICGFRNTRCLSCKMGQGTELRPAVSALTRFTVSRFTFARRHSCPPALHMSGRSPANRNFPVFPPRGRAKLQLSRKPSRSPSRLLSRFPRHLPTPAHHRIRPQLSSIRNHPAKQLRRSPSNGSRSSPAIRGQSGIWIQGFLTANGFYSGSHGVTKRRLCDINSDVDPLAV